MLVKMINYTGRYMRSDEEKETTQDAILTVLDILQVLIFEPNC